MNFFSIRRAFIFLVGLGMVYLGTLGADSLRASEFHKCPPLLFALFGLGISGLSGWLLWRDARRPNS